MTASGIRSIAGNQPQQAADNGLFRGVRRGRLLIHKTEDNGLIADQSALPAQTNDCLLQHLRFGNKPVTSAQQVSAQVCNRVGVFHAFTVLCFLLYAVRS